MAKTREKYLFIKAELDSQVKARKESASQMAAAEHLEAEEVGRKWAQEEASAQEAERQEGANKRELNHEMQALNR